MTAIRSIFRLVLLVICLLAVGQVTWGQRSRNEVYDINFNVLKQSLDRATNGLEYVISALRHVASWTSQWERRRVLPTSLRLSSRFRRLGEDAKELKKKITGAAVSAEAYVAREASATEKEVRDLLDAVENDTSSFISDLRDTIQDFKEVDSEEMRSQSQNTISLLERGADNFVQSLQPIFSHSFDGKKNKNGGRNRRPKIRNKVTPDERRDNNRVDRLPQTGGGGRSRTPQSSQVFDFRRFDQYLQTCSTCMQPTTQAQCPLNSEAVEITRWASQLQDLISQGCPEPEFCREGGCDDNRKCCLTSDSRVRDVMSQVKNLLRDLRSSIEERCIECTASLYSQWTEWGPWGACDVSCGRAGRRRRTRQCRGPSPDIQGRGCAGRAQQVEACRDLPACAAPPEWSPWGSWGACSVTCGSGVMQRTRTCENSPGSNPLTQRCEGSAVERRRCDTGRECCVDGNWSRWGTWEACSVTCGRGQTRRRRRCASPAPNSCGRPCSGSAEESRVCGQDKECCVDGNWAGWTTWAACSVTCGTGVQSRIRRCTDPAPNFCGVRCAGPASDSRACFQGECCVNGNWAPWNRWSQCSVTCGTGVRQRSRDCANPPPNSCGRPCPGPENEVGSCRQAPCIVCMNGNWAQWGAWSECSESCGSGVRSRNRICSDPAPNDCGQPCRGDDSENELCYNRKRDGNWSNWGQWTRCSASCGGGTRVRRRECNNPPPDRCGSSCPGSDSQSGRCNKQQCCVDGNWGTWMTWSTCSSSCGRGVRERRRECDSPPANYCGKQCSGRAFESGACDSGRDCCVDGTWGAWQSWSQCSASCGRGLKERRRTCDSPPANYCGKQCPGPAFQSDACESGRDCCVDGNWGSWQTWSTCSATCGRGIRERRRACDSPSANFCGKQCPGPAFESGDCESARNCCVDGNWGAWESWSTCSASCGRGLKQRSRTCDSPPANYCGKQCPGSAFESDACDSGRDCCVDGNWGSWTSWSSCSATCGDSFVTRSRECNDPPPNYCGDKCIGEPDDMKPQRCGPLAINGQWTTWTPWTECSVTCGVGSQTRYRTCSDPAPNACGEKCPGHTDHRRTCVGIGGNCDCEQKEWSTWGSWSSCSATCGVEGVQTRSRACIRIAEGAKCATDDLLCPGENFETTPCGVNLPECLSWGEWGSCSVTCRGVGVTGIRERHLIVSEEAGVLTMLNATRSETEPCVVEFPPCPSQPLSDASWAPWESWCPCSCKAGLRSRRRDCMRQRIGGAGLEKVSPQMCPGNGRQEEKCDAPINCPDCVTSCRGLPDGRYPTCKDCQTTVDCRGGLPDVFLSCHGDTEWDAYSKECMDESSSCQLHDCVRDCMGKPNGKYHDCNSCNTYVECRNNRLTRQYCPSNTEWNQITQRCQSGRSPTCKRAVFDVGFGEVDMPERRVSSTTEIIGDRVGSAGGIQYVIIGGPYGNGPTALYSGPPLRRIFDTTDTIINPGGTYTVTVIRNRAEEDAVERELNRVIGSTYTGYPTGGQGGYIFRIRGTPNADAAALDRALREAFAQLGYPASGASVEIVRGANIGYGDGTILRTSSGGYVITYGDYTIRLASGTDQDAVAILQALIRALQNVSVGTQTRRVYIRIEGVSSEEAVVLQNALRDVIQSMGNRVSSGTYRIIKGDIPLVGSSDGTLIRLSSGGYGFNYGGYTVLIDDGSEEDAKAMEEAFRRAISIGAFGSGGGSITGGSRVSPGQRYVIRVQGTSAQDAAELENALRRTIENLGLQASSGGTYEIISGTSPAGFNVNPDGSVSRLPSGDYGFNYGGYTVRVRGGSENDARIMEEALRRAIADGIIRSQNIPSGNQIGQSYSIRVRGTSDQNAAALEDALRRSIQELGLQSSGGSFEIYQEGVPVNFYVSPDGSISRLGPNDYAFKYGGYTVRSQGGSEQDAKAMEEALRRAIRNGSIRTQGGGTQSYAIRISGTSPQDAAILESALRSVLENQGLRSSGGTFEISRGSSPGGFAVNPDGSIARLGPSDYGFNYGGYNVRVRGGSEQDARAMEEALRRVISDGVVGGRGGQSGGNYVIRVSGGSSQDRAAMEKALRETMSRLRGSDSSGGTFEIVQGSGSSSTYPGSGSDGYNFNSGGYNVRLQGGSAKDAEAMKVALERYVAETRGRELNLDNFGQIGPGTDSSSTAPGGVVVGFDGKRQGYDYDSRRQKRHYSSLDFENISVKDCVSDCFGRAPGKYPSCRGCEFYVICNKRGHLRDRECARRQTWDDNKKRCTRLSGTCP